MAQGYNSRLDESLGARNGKKKQSFKDRRDESKAMSKKMYGHAYGGDHSMKYEKHYPKSSKPYDTVIWAGCNCSKVESIVEKGRKNTHEVFPKSRPILVV